MQYLLLIHRNTDSEPSAQEWDDFINRAVASGLFRGGSELANRTPIGTKAVPDTLNDIAGFMRFDADSSDALRQLLLSHPTVEHGGTVELCEMPRSESGAS